MQWDNFRILLLEGLSQGADSLIVGDVKQSIYRWRNGDWGILNALKTGNQTASIPFPVRVESLKTNRRSETTIIDFNNRLFIAATAYLNKIYIEELSEDCKPLLQAYSDVVQESPRENTQGYVKIAFVEPNEEHVSATEKSEYNGTQLINAKVIYSYLRQLLRNDLQYTPFHMVAMEKKVAEVIEIETSMGKLEMKIGGTIDRMDRKEDILRIVDYKTGGNPQTPKNIEQLFTPAEDRPNYIFQTFLYALIMFYLLAGLYTGMDRIRC